METCVYLYYSLGLCGSQKHKKDYTGCWEKMELSKHQQILETNVTESVK